MNKTFILLLSFIIFSCTINGQIIVPDTVEIGKMSSKQRVGSTRVVIDKIADYQFIPSLLRFQKSQNQFLQIAEIPNIDFTTKIPNIRVKVSQLEAQGGKLSLKKEFKLGEFDAFIALVPNGAEEQIVFAFGDETFCTLLMGTFPSNEAARKEVVDLALSAYLDKKIELNLEDQLSFSLSLKDSKYKLSTVNGGVAGYTEDSSFITVDDWQKNYFTVSVIPKPFDISLKDYSDIMIKSLGKSNKEDNQISIDVLNENITDKLIEVEMKGNTVNKELLLYQSVELTDNELIQFIGFAFENKKEQIELFKSIARSIQKK